MPPTRRRTRVRKTAEVAAAAEAPGPAFVTTGANEIEEDIVAHSGAGPAAAPAAAAIVAMLAPPELTGKQLKKFYVLHGMESSVPNPAYTTEVATREHAEREAADRLVHDAARAEADAARVGQDPVAAQDFVRNTAIPLRTAVWNGEWDEVRARNFVNLAHIALKNVSVPYADTVVQAEPLLDVVPIDTFAHEAYLETFAYQPYLDVENIELVQRFADWRLDARQDAPAAEGDQYAQLGATAPDLGWLLDLIRARATASMLTKFDDYIEDKRAAAAAPRPLNEQAVDAARAELEQLLATPAAAVRTEVPVSEWQTNFARDVKTWLAIVVERYENNPSSNPLAVFIVAALAETRAMHNEARARAAAIPSTPPYVSTPLSLVCGDGGALGVHLVARVVRNPAVPATADDEVSRDAGRVNDTDLTFEWTHNGTIVRRRVGRIVEDAYVVAVASAEDAGAYQCRVYVTTEGDNENTLFSAHAHVRVRARCARDGVVFDTASPSSTHHAVCSWPGRSGTDARLAAAALDRLEASSPQLYNDVRAFPGYVPVLDNLVRDSYGRVLVHAGGADVGDARARCARFFTYDAVVAYAERAARARADTERRRGDAAAEQRAMRAYDVLRRIKHAPLRVLDALDADSDVAWAVPGEARASLERMLSVAAAPPPPPPREAFCARPSAKRRAEMARLLDEHGDDILAAVRNSAAMDATQGELQRVYGVPAAAFVDTAAARRLERRVAAEAYGGASRTPLHHVTSAVRAIAVELGGDAAAAVRCARVLRADAFNEGVRWYDAAHDDVSAAPHVYEVQFGGGGAARVVRRGAYARTPCSDPPGRGRGFDALHAYIVAACDAGRPRDDIEEAVLAYNVLAMFNVAYDSATSDGEPAAFGRALHVWRRAAARA